MTRGAQHAAHGPCSPLWPTLLATVLLKNWPVDVSGALVKNLWQFNGSIPVHSKDIFSVVFKLLGTPVAAFQHQSAPFPLFQLKWKKLPPDAIFELKIHQDAFVTAYWGFALEPTGGAYRGSPCRPSSSFVGGALCPIHKTSPPLSALRASSFQP